MRILTFRKGGKLRAGAVAGAFAIDIQKAAKALGAGAMPDSVRAILEGGEPLRGRLKRTVRRAETRLKDAAAGKGRRPAWATPLDEAELAAPVPNPEKIICLGQNYADHCREQGKEPPASPIIFAKFPTCLIGAGENVRLPPKSVTRKVDFEIELAFVIGRAAKRVKRADAMNYIAGYTVFVDVTARDLQFADKQWVRGKSLDTFAPCGPWIVTPDEIGDPHNLRLWLRVNGETMQDSSTSNLIFKIPYLIEFLSAGITLKPGDIISTGTPPGVGIFRNPPILLQPGDVMDSGIEDVGEMRNKCVRDRG